MTQCLTNLHFRVEAWEVSNYCPKKCNGNISECSQDSQCTGRRKCCAVGIYKCCVDPEGGL